MSNTKIDLQQTPFAGLDRLSSWIGYHGRRQGVIAGNLANLDTPGYRARDLDFQETLSIRMDVGPGGGRVRSGSIAHADSIVTRDDETPDQDGNSVALETQIAKSGANTLRYQALSEVLNRKLAMLKYAASDGQR